MLVSPKPHCNHYCHPHCNFNTSCEFDSVNLTNSTSTGQVCRPNSYALLNLNVFAWTISKLDRLSSSSFACTRKSTTTTTADPQQSATDSPDCSHNTYSRANNSNTHRVNSSSLQQRLQQIHFSTILFKFLINSIYFLYERIFFVHLVNSLLNFSVHVY